MQRILCSTAVLALLMGAGNALAQTQNNTQGTGDGTTPNAVVDCSVAANADKAECKNKSMNQSQTDQNNQNNGTATTNGDNAQNNDTGTTTGTTQPSTDQNNAATTPAAPATNDSAANTAGVPAGTQFLASQFIGRTVYSSANENVGEINDLVMNKDLDTVVAIIGVGGFLGIGEKDVAIPVEQITITTETANNTMTGTGTASTDDNTTTGSTTAAGAPGTATPKLVIAMTREQLESAPAFDRTALAR
ncbi:PRC-barrel domain-containing protein [Aestuariivirga sp.]|uniref:PRC-barrel domain-containing protein n=1 Tax=Aestuariivirga sp. TaxID=2650926 RepID=UPI0039E6F280